MIHAHKQIKTTCFKSVLLNVFLSIAVVAVLLTAPLSQAGCYLYGEFAGPSATINLESQSELPPEFVWEVKPVSFDHMYRKK